MSECWLIACTTRDVNDREELYALLKKQLMKSNTVQDVGVFEIPMDLRFSAFDDLLLCADNLEKEDQLVENALKKARQLALDINPNMVFKINAGGRQWSVLHYLSKFTWDDRKFPKYVPLNENLKTLSQLVQKLVDDITLKAIAYSDLKHKKQLMNSNMETATIYRDLIYVITPDVVEDPNDFMETEHLTTVIVFVPFGAEEEFLRVYMSLATNIVPNCAKNINIKCKSYSLWRVIIFKSSVNTFVEGCKSNNFMAQQFTYSPERYNILLNEQSKLEADTQRHQALLSRIYDIAHSDIFTCWIHLKAMRIFCESVLRFGLPIRFACFYLFPLNSTKSNQIHKILTDMLPQYSNYAKSGKGDHSNKDAGIQDDSYFPYVHFSLNVG